MQETIGLIRTPEPMADESPHGYLLRLADANGMALQTLIDLATQKSEYVATVGWDYQLLQPLLGDLALPRDFGYRPARYIRGSMLLRGEPIASRHLGMYKARFCPRCVEALGYIPTVWDLKAYVACTVHGTMMLKYCPVCSKRIKVRRPSLIMCNCGADLRQATPDPAPPELLALCEVLSAKLSRDSRNPTIARALELPVDDLLAMDLEIMCRVFVGVAEVLRALSEGTPRKRLSHAKISELLPSVGQVFSRWPVNFYEFCRQCAEKFRSMNRDSHRFQACFSWLFVRLNKNLRSRRRQTEFMLKAALEYGYRHWDRSPIYLNDARLKKLELPEPRYARLVDAAAAVGVPSRMLRYWIEQRRIPDMRCDGINRTLMFDMESVKQIVVSQFPAMKVRSAARKIGIPHKVYIELRRQDEIPCNHLTPNQRSVAVEDVDAFVRSVTARAQHVASVRRLISLSKYLGSKLPIGEKIAMIRDIRDGRKAVYFRGRPKIGNLWLTENILAAAKESRRSLRAKFTMKEFARRFSLSFYESRALFRHIFGSAETKRSLNDAALRKLEQFLSRYVSLRTISRSERVYSKAIVYAMRRNGDDNALLKISAGCGPAKRGVVHVTFVARSAIAKIVLIARRIRQPRGRRLGSLSQTMCSENGHGYRH